jgi:hypothetical protein
MDLGTKPLPNFKDTLTKGFRITQGFVIYFGINSVTKIRHGKTGVGSPKSCWIGLDA